MATYKVLGQSAPSATTNTDAYTAAAQAIVSSIVICNRSTATTFRVAVRPAGASIANQHYLVYDAPIAANDTTALTLGISMAATDVLTIYAGTANLSFSAFGVESP